MKKRILGVALAGALAFSAIAGSFATVSAAEGEKAKPNPYRLPEYTPTAGVETRKVMFAMPGSWIGEKDSVTRQTWEKYGATAGLYWWGGDDNPDDYPAANKHGWPGWKMKKEDSNIPNLFSTLASRTAPNMIFSNFIDGGMDEAEPEYNTSQQTEDLQVEYFGIGDSDYFPYSFWDYMYENYYDRFLEEAEKQEDDPSYKPDYSIPEFGEYADNFFFDINDDSIYQYIDDMVFVADYNIDPSKVSPVSGKAGFPGAFYFYYGNGEFGIWPTREMCIEKEGLTVDADGKIVYEGTKKNAETGADEAFKETVDEKTDFILRKGLDAYQKSAKKTDVEKDFVVFGNITGKYWSDTAAPEMPTVEPKATEATTVPAPGSTDATSNEGSKNSDSNSGTGSNDSNGSIATGDYSAVAIFAVFAIAGLGVFYFVRKRRSNK